jgi:hypothetical protein
MIKLLNWLDDWLWDNGHPKLANKAWQLRCLIEYGDWWTINENL